VNVYPDLSGDKEQSYYKKLIIAKN
jgi:hypothetical protein